MRIGEDAGASYEAEAAAITALLAAKFAGLRRRLPKWEIPAAVRALRDEKEGAMSALRARRLISRLLVPVPPPPRGRTPAARYMGEP